MKKDTFNYYQQMQHPLWQKKRLEVMEYAQFECQHCGAREDQLNVHHPVYKRGAMIWDYEVNELECLCDKCHKAAHVIDERIKHDLVELTTMCGHEMKYMVLGFINGLALPPFKNEFSHYEQYQLGYMQGLGPSPFDTYAEAYEDFHGDKL